MATEWDQQLKEARWPSSCAALIDVQIDESNMHVTGLVFTTLDGVGGGAARAEVLSDMLATDTLLYREPVAAIHFPLSLAQCDHVRRKSRRCAHSRSSTGRRCCSGSRQHMAWPCQPPPTSPASTAARHSMPSRFCGSCIYPPSAHRTDVCGAAEPVAAGGAGLCRQQRALGAARCVR